MEKKVILSRGNLREEVAGVATGRQATRVTDCRMRSGVEKIGKAASYWIAKTQAVVPSFLLSTLQ